MEKILQAIDFATIKHSGQLRKGKKTPYVTHALAVGVILANFTNNEDVIVAGILHDTIEDTKTTNEEIKSLFGEHVLNLVLACTEQEKSISWNARKKQVIKKIKHLSDEAALIKSADMLHNLYDIRRGVAEQGSDYLNIFNADPATKLALDRKLLTELKTYHKNNPLLGEIEKHLLFIESLCKK